MVNAVKIFLAGVLIALSPVILFYILMPFVEDKTGLGALPFLMFGTIPVGGIMIIVALLKFLGELVGGKGPQKEN